eukprot:2565804-Rhodomonas_salina.1
MSGTDVGYAGARRARAWGAAAGEEGAGCGRAESGTYVEHAATRREGAREGDELDAFVLRAEAAPRVLAPPLGAMRGLRGVRY